MIRTTCSTRGMEWAARRGAKTWTGGCVGFRVGLGLAQTLMDGLVYRG